MVSGKMFQLVVSAVTDDGPAILNIDIYSPFY